MFQHPDIEHALAATGRLMRPRGYGSRTIDVYVRWLRRFADAYPGLPVEDFSRQHVEKFLSDLTENPSPQRC
jgi:hypothetical protein